MKFKFLILFYCLSINIFSQNIELIESFIGYQEDSEIISFTPNNRIILSGDYSGKLNLWDLKHQTIIKSINAHSRPINSIKFSENGKKFTTCSSDSCVKIWDFNSGRLIDSIKIQSIPQIAIFNKNENGYLIFDEDGNVFEKKFRNKKLAKKFTNEQKFLDAILSHDKNYIITCDEKSLKMKDYYSGDLTWEIEHPTKNIFSKVQIHSKDTLVLWSKNGNINFWEIENKNPLLEINATNLHNRLSINRHCDIIISGYYKDRPFLINLNEIDFSEDYKTDFVIANTFLSSLNKKYLVSSGTKRRHRLMEIKKHKFFPISVQKRKVADKKEFLTDSRYVVLEIWDNAQIDGDTVSLNFNGKWILKDYGLVRGKKQVFLKLEEGQSNELIFYAKNLGKISPNTTAITLIDRKDKKEFEINSNLDENGKITLINTNKANFLEKNLLD
ncbi:MAG: WD40 repeat domain-containing protein [Bacteroidota bacterium]|nr:WD40 repeat domain-containing protein [Bacteroidota bacterium]